MKKANIYIINTASKRIVFILLLLTVLVACNNAPNEPSTTVDTNKQQTEMVELTDEQYKNAAIELGAIEKKLLSNVLKVNGVMDVPPQNLVSVSALLGGFVYSTELLQGMKVKKGQIIAVLEHPDYIQLQQDFIDKKSKLEFLELEYNRQEELNKENVNSAKVFQQVKSDYMSMKAQVKGNQEKLALIGIDADKFSVNNISRKINIYSPINGYVSEVNVNIGKYVSPNDVMFEIVDTEHLHAELTVYEKDAVKLKIGQKIRFTLPNESDKERKASIHLIGRKIDEDRSVRVHAHLDDEDAELLPGMYINALIELNNNMVDAVPNEAVVMMDGKYFIYVLKEKQNNVYHFEMLEVQKKVSELGYSEISLKNNTAIDKLKVVTKGAFVLLSKMKNSEEDGAEH